MHHIKRVILSVVLIVAVFSGPVAYAAATNLPAGILIGDQNGIQVSVDGEYFIDWEGLNASDTLTKRLNIHNMEPYSYKISMTAEPLEETGPLHLLDEVSVTLKLDGKVIYDGRVRGDDGINMILNALDLGNYNSGDQRVLDISMKVDPDMKKYYWKISEAFFKWNFYAVRVVPYDGGSPKTGEIIKNGMYALMGGIAGATVILLVLKKKQREKEANPQGR